MSRDHVQAAVAGGFTQADHGKDTRLKRLNKGDLLVFYSPKTKFRDGEPLQAFTALGEVIGTEPYQVEVTADFHPWRMKMDFKKGNEIPVRSIIGNLEFIKDKEKWGLPFRRGLFEITQADFGVIAKAMSVTL